MRRAWSGWLGLYPIHAAPPAIYLPPRPHPADHARFTIPLPFRRLLINRRVSYEGVKTQRTDPAGGPVLSCAYRVSMAIPPHAPDRKPPNVGPAAGRRIVGVQRRAAAVLAGLSAALHTPRGDSETEPCV